MAKIHIKMQNADKIAKGVKTVKKEKSLRVQLSMNCLGSYPTMWTMIISKCFMQRSNIAQMPLS